jgi:radical SAM superfamily enzyme YgiQ (UPF0313 family)
MMKVLLVNPKSEYTFKEENQLPLPLLYIAAKLEGVVDVKIIDQQLGNWENELTNNLDQDVLCVGVTSMTGPQLKQAIRISKMVKSKGIPVIWGGIHASLTTEQTLLNDFVDIVVIGEGDLTFPEVVSQLLGNKELDKVNGIAYKKDGKVRFTSQRNQIDMDALPEVPYHLVDMSKYFLHPTSNPTERVLPIQTSRGCPYNCKFCYNLLFNMSGIYHWSIDQWTKSTIIYWKVIYS